MIDQNGSFKIVSNGLGLKFNSVVKDLIAGKKYFFRAYARNKEGVGYGPVLDLKTVRNISPWWIDAVRCGYELVDQFMVWFLLHE